MTRLSIRSSIYCLYPAHYQLLCLKSTRPGHLYATTPASKSSYNKPTKKLFTNHKENSRQSLQLPAIWANEIVCGYRLLLVVLTKSTPLGGLLQINAQQGLLGPGHQRCRLPRASGLYRITARLFPNDLS